MINGNSTFAGGCPNPPPSAVDTERYAKSIAAAISFADKQDELWEDVTESSLEGLKNITGHIVTDTFLGAFFVAGRSCGPPGSLSSSTLEAIATKYLNGMALEHTADTLTCHLCNRECKCVSRHNRVKSMYISGQRDVSGVSIFAWSHDP